MLWYFLYPLRGTSQPPRLSANHPIRRAFYRHGKITAQHWLVAMLVSVAIAMGFSYPTILLAENPTAGFAAYPHHVWTTAKPFEGDPSLTDVEMRQVWVHGSYMKALEKDVLKSALHVQQTLVGDEMLTTVFPALSEKLRSSTLSWGYHSPLMYWNNSQEALECDNDVARTINDQSRRPSSLNVVLRPASVFAGKKFTRRRLTAADALVITLMNKVQFTGEGRNAGGRWTDKMKALAQGACYNCTLFPNDGDVTRSRVYEFSFKPLSAPENIILTFAYSCMALYVLLSLRRLKAFHSRFGLVVTAITQMTCSIMASFTICGILKINLSMIPQNGYPFVVLVIGLENMFRLINAVLAYPPTMATELRIANALGDIGPVSAATAAQNVAILSLLARFVSPGVAAFCAFACIATLFDAFFLLTFFVAVLNVDIRRLELQDALTRSNQARAKRKPSPTTQRTWLDALVHGRLPFSTRMAGTAVTTTFILSLNYHFFERHEKASTLGDLLGLVRKGPPSIADFDTFTPPPMNATLTPGEWMRMQDFDTAKEVMRLAKPGADSFIIRVFAPFIIVLPGADRTGAPLGAEEWFHSLRSFAIHHFYPVAVAVVFAVAFVAVLMNFLLYSDAGEESDSEERFEDALSVTTIMLRHKLDIVKLAGTGSGHFVSVGLDRSIAVSTFDPTQKAHRSMDVTPEMLLAVQWPIRHMVLDDNGEWLACHNADNSVLLYNCQAGRIIDRALQYPDDNPPILMQFVRLPAGDVRTGYLIILTSGGRLAMYGIDLESKMEARVLDVPLVGAEFAEAYRQKQRLLVVSEDARLVAFVWSGANWSESCGIALPLQTPFGRLTGRVELKTYPELGDDTLVIIAINMVLFVDSQSLAIIAKFPIDNERETDVHIILGTVTNCPACGGVALRSISFAKPDADGKRCHLETLHADGNVEAPMCLRGVAESCRTLRDCRRHKYELVDAGIWHALSSQAVLGLRKRQAFVKTELSKRQVESVTLRHHRHPRAKAKQDESIDQWEAYKFCINGTLEATDASSTTNTDPEHTPGLFVNSAGPAAGMDSQSVVVAFGNSVKIIRASRRGSMIKRTNAPSLERQSSTSRKRMALRKVQ